MTKQLSFPCPIEPLIAHSSPMSLLDEVLSANDQQCTAQVKITERTRFMTAQGVPAWVGIEYMAQTIAAYAGVKAHNKSAEVKIGFLVGSRRYSSEMPFFGEGMELKVQVSTQLEQSGGLSVFDCVITDNSNALIAQASLNVFEPEDIDAFMEEM